MTGALCQVLARCYLESDKKGSSVEDTHKKEQRDMRMSVRLYVIQGINLMSQVRHRAASVCLSIMLIL